MVGEFLHRRRTRSRNAVTEPLRRISARETSIFGPLAAAMSSCSRLPRRDQSPYYRLKPKAGLSGPPATLSQTARQGWGQPAKARRKPGLSIPSPEESRPRLALTQRRLICLVRSARKNIRCLCSCFPPFASCAKSGAPHSGDSFGGSKDGPPVPFLYFRRVPSFKVDGRRNEGAGHENIL
jgi:hypothetical protein